MALTYPSHRVGDITIHPLLDEGRGSTPHSCFKESCLCPTLLLPCLQHRLTCQQKGPRPPCAKAQVTASQRKGKKGQRKYKFTSRGNHGFFRSGRVIRPIISLADRK